MALPANRNCFDSAPVDCVKDCMEQHAIHFIDRYSGREQTEQVYGEVWLRRVYGTPLGRSLLLGVVSRAWFSRLYGWWMSRPASRSKIRPFISAYGINEDEMAEPAGSFGSFNAFFTRLLKASARPLAEGDGSLLFPADGRHMGFARLGQEQQVFVKGQQWNLAALLGHDPQLVEKYTGGTLVLSRLCPVDYHHFHYPVSGLAGQPHWIDGRLYSVSPIALRQRLDYIWENKRCLTEVALDCGRSCLFIEVGATNVGSIRHLKDAHGVRVERGQRKGWFEFGGSTVITLFPPDTVRLDEDLLAASARGIELYAKVNDHMGHLSN